MKRYFYSVCVLAGAVGLPVAGKAADVPTGASGGKGARSTPVAPTTQPQPAHERAVARQTHDQPALPSRLARPSEPFIVITPRLPDSRDGAIAQDSAPADSTGYLPPLDRLRREACAAAAARDSSTDLVVKTETVAKTETVVKTQATARTQIVTKTQMVVRTTLVTKAAPVMKTPLIVIRDTPFLRMRPTTLAGNPRLDSATLTTTEPGGRLARVTAYWPCEGDYYTRHSIAATGVRLHDGHCAVDPNIIPYGSVVNIAGVGKFLAVDTGSAVISRTAAREAGHTSAERNAIVVDLFFEDRSDGERFASSEAKWAPVSWWTPSSNASQAREARSLFAEEDWTKIHGKQL